MTDLATPTKADLAHIPHLPTWPLVGHTLSLLRDPYRLHGRSESRLGQVYKILLLGQWRVTLAGADAMDLIYGDPERILSSHHGWDMIHTLFPNGLMLRDFEDHRVHRRIMQSAFRKPVMDAYRERINALMPKMIDQWPVEKPFAFFPAIKELTLRMGAAVFMGLEPDDPRVTRLNQAFQDEVNGAVGVIRKPLPFTALRRGQKARAYLLDFFRELIPERRANPGNDFFSQMCLAEDDTGAAWTEEEILDHFNFLMMAAHDTTAASLTKAIWALAAHPDWQDRVEAEIRGLEGEPDSDEVQSAMEVSGRVFREALRLLPPVPFIPRRTIKAFDWQGVHIPAGTWVSAAPGMVHMSPLYWSDPEEFDPDRFSPNRAEDRSHKYAWSPFGGGAHKCIGMHFATMEAKIFLYHLLGRYRVELARKRPVRWQRLPIPRPVGGLPIRLVAHKV